MAFAIYLTLLFVLYIVCAPVLKLYFYICRQNVGEVERVRYVDLSHKYMSVINTIAMIATYITAAIMIVWVVISII